jgi:preprotein translocase subunit SecA
MTLWSWLTRRQIEESDEVWATTIEKLEGVARAARAAIDAGKRCLVSAHFRSTLDDARTSLRTLHPDARSLTDTRAVGDFRAARGTAVGLALVDVLPADTPAVPVPDLVVIAVERHPMHAPDETISHFALASGVSQVTFHTALDEPLLTKFGAERLTELLRRLGLSAGTSVSHAMLTRAIRNAQQSIARAAVASHPAASPAEWMRYNLPPGD